MDEFGISPAMTHEEMIRLGLLVRNGKVLEMTPLGIGLKEREWSFETHIVCQVNSAWPGRALMQMHAVDKLGPIGTVFNDPTVHTVTVKRTDRDRKQYSVTYKKVT